MKRKQSGFAVLETILVLLILGLIAAAGYYVWQSNHSDEPAQADTASRQTTTAPKNLTTKQLIAKTDEASSLVKKTYSDYSVSVTKSNNVSKGLFDIRSKLADEFYVSLLEKPEKPDPLFCTNGLLPESFRSDSTIPSQTIIGVGLDLDGELGTEVYVNVNMTSMKIVGIECQTILQ
jgi:cell division protein YceG involved in septum cleavage